MSKRFNHLYEFGQFRLDAGERLLLRDEKPIPLPPKAFDTLLVLVERGGRLVEKDELLKEVWADTFVEEANLARNIWKLRQALGDDDGECRYIETVPKRGYRFVAAVSKVPNETVEVVIQSRIRAGVVVEEEDSANDQSDVAQAIVGDKVAALTRPTEPQAAATVEGSGSPESIAKYVARQTKNRRTAILAALVIIGLIASGLIVAVIRRNGTANAPAGPANSVAVMPFANDSGDPELAYLSDGITENLISRLSRAPNLKMVAYSRVIRYRDKEIDPQKAGRELGVQAILLGRVTQRGGELTVSAELVDVRDGSHLWGERYDRKTSDLLFLQKQLAQDIVNGLRLQFTGEAQKRIERNYTDNTEAYRLYLKGRYFWNRRDAANLNRGIEYFNKAIEQDPNYALAYAGLSDSYIMLANWSVAPPREAYPKAKAAALRALELDQELAEAHTSLAYITLLYDWDWVGAEKGFRQAIALNPNYASAHHFYSICLMTAGRHEEALVEIQRALELDPLSLIINDVLGWIYYEGRRFDQAKQQFERTLEMDPGYAPALLDLGANYLRTGKYSEAIAQFQKARDASSDTGVVLSGLAQAYALSGQKAEALKILGRLEQRSEGMFVSLWDLSLIYLAIGDKEKAIQLLEKAADERVGWVTRLGVDPAFDSLRGEPRFEQLKRRVGIPQQPR